MVVEELIKARWAEKRPLYSFIMGIFFSALSFLTSWMLFNQTSGFIGISAILFTVILVVPTVNKLFDIEERIEVKKGKSFFKKHEHIIDFFIYFFLGIFCVFLVVGLIKPEFIFSENQLYNLKSSSQIDSRNLPPPPSGSFSSEVMKIFTNNLCLLGIAFALSLFYGSGALFLITLNASVFASVISKVILAKASTMGLIHLVSYGMCNIGIVFFHMIPEISGYLLAAIAGGVLSHAFIREKLGSSNFKIVLIDSLILLLISIIVLLISAIIEIFISKRLINNLACFNAQYIIIFFFVMFVVVFILFEILRKRHTLS